MTTEREADIADVRRCVNQLRTAPARMSAQGLLDACDELHALSQRQGDLLTGAINALRGEPPKLTWWSHHDVVERAQQVVAERDALRRALVAVRHIGTQSGTDVNAWNKAFDVIDAALAEKP